MCVHLSWHHTLVLDTVRGMGGRCPLCCVAQVPQGGIGEVCIRGPNVTKGYLNNPKANAEAYAGGEGSQFASLRFSQEPLSALSGALSNARP